MKKIFLIAALSTIVYTSCTFEKAVPLPAGCDATMFYQTDIKPIIDSYCVSCHTTGASQGDFTDFSVLKAKVDAGSFKNRVLDVKDMPPGGSPQPTADELQKLRCWMEQGAPNN